MKQLFLALALTFLAAATVWSQDWSAVPPLTQHSVLRMESTSKDDGGVCSAVVIAPQVVATAAHCIPMETEGRSFIVGRKHAKLEKVNYALDLAVLKVEKLDAPALKIRTTALAIGTPISIAGYGLGFEVLRYQFGWVSDPIGEKGFLVGPFLDARIFPGDSGGAVLDLQGRLVTLAVASLGPNGRPNAWAIGVDPKEFYEFVEDFLPPAVK